SAPLREVLRRQPREIVLAMFARMAEQTPFYIFTAFVFTYGVETVKVPRDFLLLAVLAASILSFVSIPLFGHISDLIGRKRIYLLGAVVTLVFGFVYFGLLGTGSRGLIFLAIVLSLIPHDMLYGPQAALIAESFKGRVRYSGASLGYQLAAHRVGIVHEQDRLKAPGARVEVEYVRAIEGHARAVFQPPVVEVVSDRAQVPLGTHQHVVHGEPGSLR